MTDFSKSLLLLSLLWGADDPRTEISLDGLWECQRVSELQEPPSGGSWTACSVPGYLSGTNYQLAWLRRSFTVPEALRGRRLELRFGGVKYNSRVFVNGRRVGGCFGGYEAFAVDVTAAVRFDGPNELAVGCHDWTGVFTPERVVFPENANWDAIRSAPADRILSPIGGLYGLFGIWDGVALQAHPAVFIKDVFVKPSVRRQELAVEYTVANESDRDAQTTLCGAVEDAGNDIREFEPAAVSIPAGQSVAVTLRRPWSNPPLWSHADPHLLTLRSWLESGDRLRTRFGFREFWVEGDKFFLNGTRVNLLATSWWPPQKVMDRDAIRKAWRTVKQIGCVAFRTHTQPWPALHYDVADEAGLMMIVEGAVWNDDNTYRIYDPRFWDNYAAHLKAMVAQHKNRPSVVMWSLENEFLGGRLNDRSPAKKDLVRMGRLVKQWDPTRPIFYESDGDPDGVADCIGIHYPHEYPDFTCWPNEAYWLRRPAAIPHMFLNGAESFVWRRDKPLYLGEFLWTASRDPSWHTVFFGDEAYRDYHAYRNRAKAESWKMQILGYRDLEVGGLSPWTVIEGGPMDESNPLYRAHQSAYQPVAAYPFEYDSRFYGGERVTRRLAVFNDILEPSLLVLHWQLMLRGRAIATERSVISLAPGEHKHLDVVLPLPNVTQREPVVWKWRVERGDKTAAEDQRDLSVFPPPQLPRLAARIGLYDPAGATQALFDKAQLNTRAIESLAQLPSDLDVLVIGACCLQPTTPGVPVVGDVSSPRQSLVDFTARGGRVLVLRQEAYPEGLLDVSLTSQQSTMTFPQAVHHPALAGLEAEDFKFWRGDHRVTSAEVARPTAGAVPLVVSGSAAGIDTTPLVARPIGQGCMVFCQMLLTEKYDREPAAARLLSNLLAWLDGYRAVTGQTAVYGPPEYKALLASLGLRFDEVGDWSSQWRAAPPRLVICRGAAPDAAPLRKFVEQGGHLWLHRLPLERLGPLAAALGAPLEARPYAGPVTRVEDDAPLLDHVTREDLYWLGRHEGIGWAETPRVATMADGVFCKSLSGKSVASYEVEDWELEGGIVERQAPGVAFATVGVARQTIKFPATGQYLIGVHARGTPTAGVFPLVRIAVDGQIAGVVSAGDAWQTTTVVARIDQGLHELSVAFINDASNPPLEDRNLFVDRVLVAPDDGRDRVAFLTTPAALAVSRCGQGLVVWDQIAWDTEESNARKATRLAGSLLTALGAEFAPRVGTMIEAERMTPQPGVPHFSNAGGFASMACNGYIASPFRVAQAGRYRLEVIASGSAAANVYPEVEVLVDGRSAGTIRLSSPGWRSYALPLDLSLGDHQLRLAFINDFNRGGEDRNLRLDRVTFYRE